MRPFVHTLRSLHVGLCWSATTIVRLSFRSLVLTAFAGCHDVTEPKNDIYENPVGTHVGTFVTIAGTGAGGVSVTPKSIPEASFVADIKVRVRGALPNTTYTVQRAPELGRANGSNGICERALGLAPWSSSDTPAPGFLSFVPTGSTTPISLTTTATGDGLVDFEFRVATIPTGTKFDVMFRLVNDPAAPTGILISQCFTVTVL
jgi:hypothetical protein